MAAMGLSRMILFMSFGSANDFVGLFSNHIREIVKVWSKASYPQ